VTRDSAHGHAGINGGGHTATTTTTPNAHANHVNVNANAHASANGNGNANNGMRDSVFRRFSLLKGVGRKNSRMDFKSNGALPEE
jgi:hypothetical protein